MRPPMQTATALQQQHEQQQQQQQQQYSANNYFAGNDLAHKSKEKELQAVSVPGPGTALPPLPLPLPLTSASASPLIECLVEKKNAAARIAFPKRDSSQLRSEDSIQLVDLSSSNSSAASNSNSKHPCTLVRRHKPEHSVRRNSLASQASSLASPISDDDNQQQQFSGSSYSSQSFHVSNSFDEAAEHFTINYPSEDTCINLPLSETEPLLTNVERAICLNKNSASLIFTRKELPGVGIGVGVSGNNARINWRQQLNLPRKQARHLPAQYQQQQQQQHQQQQRRSLQLNYGNNSNAGRAKRVSNSVTIHKSQQQQQQHNQTTSLITTGLTSPSGSGNGSSSAIRKQYSHSWYAPVYTALEEEHEQDSRETSPIHRNLANTKCQNATSRYQQQQQHHHQQQQQQQQQTESAALLETHGGKSNWEIGGRQLPQQQQQQPTTRRQTALNAQLPNSMASAAKELNLNGISSNYEHERDSAPPPAPTHISPLGLANGEPPLPRRRKWEHFIKSLIGFKRPSNTSNSTSNMAATVQPQRRPASPEIVITRTPSEQNVVLRDPAGGADKQLLQRNSNPMPTNESGVMRGSTSSLEIVQQKLWHMLHREGSESSLLRQRKGLRKCETVLALTRQGSSGAFSINGSEQIRPLNRLRNSATSMNVAGACSRCSSILSLAASVSRYSLNISTATQGGAGGGGGFVSTLPPLGSEQQQQSTAAAGGSSSCSNNNIRSSHSHIAFNTSSTNYNNHEDTLDGSLCSRKSSTAADYAPSNVTTATLSGSTPTPTPADAFGGNNNCYAYPLTISSLLTMSAVNGVDGEGAQKQQQPVTPTSATSPLSEMPAPPAAVAARAVPCFRFFKCKLCLIDVESASDATTLQQCGCKFCTECVRSYIEFEITEGAYEISCPDAMCPAQGVITLPEISGLTTSNLLKKHHRYRLNREIELDKSRTWCPRAGCETICDLRATEASAPSTSATMQLISSKSSIMSDGRTPPSCPVKCPACNDEFCFACKKTWHPNVSCEEHSRRLIADGQDDIGIPFDTELIKCCPMCAVPIEKDEGCAQMMCKRCKHVFCWYCLASLDDDFLLRHYDKGPCKNKLGHSRASVVWHRAQVIGIFAGFGILLLVASPLLLVAAPCLICCKCNPCGNKLEEVDGDMDDDTNALQS